MDYLSNVVPCPCCEGRFCETCDDHWAECGCPGPGEEAPPSPRLNRAEQHGGATMSVEEVQAELRRVERENTRLREKLDRWSAYLERQE